MTWSFQNIPIKRKLMWVLMLTSITVLVLCLASFLFYELITFRSGLREHIKTVSEIIAANSVPSLSFDVPSDAQEVLSALRLEKSVVAAAIQNRSGRIFAYLGEREANPGNLFRQPTGFYGGYLVMVQPIVQNREVIGTLYVKATLEGMYQRFRVYGVSVLFVLLGSFAVAFVLASALQRRISQPILELAGTAKAVSDQKDYSVRARKYGNDELGLLTDSFNYMLAQIHERDVALRAGDERLRLALQGANTGTWDWDVPTGRFEWSDFTAPLFGLKPGQFAQTHEAFLALVYPQDRSALQQELERSLSSGREFTVEFRVTWPDGTIRQLAARGKAHPDGAGQMTRMIGVCMDVTESKRAEEEIRRLNAELEQRVLIRTAELASSNRELEAFTYSVSHDLRAPLRHIVAFAQMLEEEFGPTLDPAAREYLTRIMLGARNMGHLVDDLLNLARVGRQVIVRQITGLNSLVDEVLIDIAPELEGRAINWKVGRLPFVECDPGLVKQVFANLISNAVKYTRPRQEAVIEIDHLRSDDQTVIVIKDNGVGFNMKYVDKLFGVFHRLHRAEEFEGTGVGLATVKRIVTMHGGRVWVEAELDKGAAFFFTLEPKPSPEGGGEKNGPERAA